MLKIACDCRDTLLLGELVPFQGNLKKRTKKDIKGLCESIRLEGLLMPFAVWNDSGCYKLLDGHGRYAALLELARSDDSIISQRLPVIFIDAEDEETARKSLLQITSAYGRITKEGAQAFCASIPTYKAPSINKFMHKKIVERKLPSQSMERVIRIAVPNDRADAVLELFKQVEYIRVL